MAITDYKTNPDQNTAISGINIAEGCPPSGINNAIRQLMADIAEGAQTTYNTILTTSGTWTAPHSGKYLIFIQGAGGGGGGCGSGTFGGGGGGCGGECRFVIKRYTKGQKVALVVGAGGSGGVGSKPTTAAYTPGVAGGQSSFDGISSAGGAGGHGTSHNATNAVYLGPSQSDTSKNSPSIRMGGGPSHAERFSSGTISNIRAGGGGDSLFGTGGGAPFVSASQASWAGNAGKGYGSGGSGAGANNGMATGGSGAAGCINVIYIGG